MPMRDASAIGTKTTLALTGSLGTTVVSTALDLVSARAMAVPIWAHIYLPSNPTGTSPSIKVTLTECDTVGGTYTDLGLLKDTDTGTTGFPKEAHQGYVPRKRFLKASVTLANTDNVYGNMDFWITAKAAETRTYP
jgi:hypothetical protein